MRDWKFWDWVGYGMLGASALALAVKESIDKMPGGHFAEIRSQPLLAWLPIILFAIGTIVFLTNHFGLIKKSKAPPSPNFSSPASSKAEHLDKVFVGEDVTPSFLNQILNTHTAIQSDKLIAVYLGKWMKIEGTVSQVRNAAVGGFRVTVKAPKTPPLLPIGLRFHGPWASHAEMLKRGDKISAIGKIESVSALGLYLEDCEIG